MILDFATFLDIQDGKKKRVKRAIASFLELIERKLGARVVFDKFNFPYGKAELASCFALTRKMKEVDLITAVYPINMHAKI